MKQFKSFFGYWVFLFIIFFFLLLYSEKKESTNLEGRYYVYFFIFTFTAIIAFNLEFIRLKFENKNRFWMRIVFFSLIINAIHSFIYQWLTTGKIESIYAIVFQSLLSTLILFALIVFRNFKLFKFNYVEFNFGWKQNIKLLGKTILLFSVIIFAFYYELLIDSFKLDHFHIIISQVVFFSISIILLSYFVFYFGRNIKISNLIKIIVCSIIVLIFINFVSLASFDIKHSNLFFTLILNLFPASFILFYVFNSYYKKNELVQENLNLNVSKIQLSQEYQNLKNQINPHFLFNNLNTLIGFIEENPKKAIAFGHHLSDVYRHSLQSNHNDFIALNDELNFITSYLDIYKAKFNANLSYTISTDILNEDYILSNVLQEIVDNIFKHNIVDDEHVLQLTMFKLNNYFVIKNNKHPKEVVQSTQTGLANISKRYELLTSKSVSILHSEDFFEIQIPILQYDS